MEEKKKKPFHRIYHNPDDNRNGRKWHKGPQRWCNVHQFIRHREIVRFFQEKDRMPLTLRNRHLLNPRYGTKWFPSMMEFVGHPSPTKQTTRLLRGLYVNMYQTFLLLRLGFHNTDHFENLIIPLDKLHETFLLQESLISLHPYPYTSKS